MIPVSPGELMDKMTILEIKRLRLTDKSQLTNVKFELALLDAVYRATIRPSFALDALNGRLATVNQELWEAEDQIRQHERQGSFGESFIRLARSIYSKNDMRASIKREINLILGSEILEEKSCGIIKGSNFQCDK